MIKLKKQNVVKIVYSESEAALLEAKGFKKVDGPQKPQKGSKANADKK